MSDKHNGFASDPAAEERLARKLRDAGPRPGLPAEAEARLRQATRAAIDRRIAKRRQTRRMGWVAAAAMIVVVVLGARFLPWPGDGATGPSARVVVSLGPDGATLPVGSDVALHQWIETGADSLVALRSTTGHSIRVGPDSRIRYSALDRLELSRGAVYIDSGRNPGVSLSIETPVGRVEELGTRYLVETAGSSLVIRVRGGRVAVRHGAENLEAEAGYELIVDESGAVSRNAIPVHGPRWQWVLDAAPAPDIDGRPLSELLDWVVRETGWRLEYGDPETARRAPGIEIHGSVEGLSPDEALDTILPTCGLSHTVRSGTLLVEDHEREPHRK